MDAHQKALLLRQRITDLYSRTEELQPGVPIPSSADLDAAEAALDEHLLGCRDELADRPEWESDYLLLDDYRGSCRAAPRFALIDITDHAQRCGLMVGKAWIESVIPQESRAQVLAAAGAVMVPVDSREICRRTFQVTTPPAGVLAAVHYSLILRHDVHNTLTATILA